MQKPAKEHLAWKGSLFFSYWFRTFCGLWAAGLILTFPIWWVFAAIAVIGGTILVLSIESVPPAHAALVLRLGRRVVSDYFKDIKDTAEQEPVPPDEVENPDFDPNVNTIHREYFTKGEGLRIVFPFIETLRIFSLERREKTVDAEDTFVQGGISVVPEMLYVWRISNPGRAIEFATGEGGDIITALTKGLDDAIVSGARTVFATCSLEQAIQKAIPKEEVKKQVALGKDGENIPLGDVIFNDIRDLVTPWGIALEAVRIRDVKPGDGAQDVFDQWEALRKADLKKQEDTTLAERDLKVRTLAAQAGLVEAQRRAEGVRVEVAALVGKKPENVTPEDAKTFMAYKGINGMTDALGKDTKVILTPPGDLGNLTAGLTSIVSAVAKTTNNPGTDGT